MGLLCSVESDTRAGLHDEAGTAGINPRLNTGHHENQICLVFLCDHLITTPDLGVRSIDHAADETTIRARHLACC